MNNYFDEYFKLNTRIKTIFNAIMLGIITCFSLWLFFHMIQDINKKYNVELSRNIKLKEQCEKEYRKNNCHKAEIPPALEDFCLEKEVCMYTDPADLTLTTRMFGKFTTEVVNDTVQPLAYKSLIVIFVFTIGIILSVNLGLSNNFMNKLS